MRPLPYLTVALLFTSSLSYASCNNYGAAGVHCSAPDGSTTSYHNYGGGISTVNDSRGNTASINRYEGGYVGVNPGATTGSYGYEYAPPKMNIRSPAIVSPFNR